MIILRLPLPLAAEKCRAENLIRDMWYNTRYVACLGRGDTPSSLEGGGGQHSLNLVQLQY